MFDLDSNTNAMHSISGSSIVDNAVDAIAVEKVKREGVDMFS